MDRITENNIVDEVKKSFIDYSMSVIVSRAIPDLKDGLKPVHRRILYTMFEDGLTPDKQYRKCAKTVGDVMGNYHPHGDSSIYDAMVRMAQDFSYRYMLVDGHGNFGNMDGDGAAAYRYTEAKLSKISLELLKDINKNTVDFMPNFDETKEEPIVLPSRFPNILVNGTMGIAVGMATNIPPHNLGEVIDGCVAYIDNPDIELNELMQLIKGPDFPTGGIILGNSGIKKAYETGRGSITIRCKAAIEEEHGRSKIVITELPYGINTLELKTKIGDLVRSKMLDGIADYHDATSLDTGVNIIITLKQAANPNVVLNNLYKHTQLQSSFGIIFLMLDNGVPKTLGLKDIISKYIDHQKDVIVRRTQFDLAKAENRVHILEGLKIALDHIDEIIKLIKAAKSDEEALKALIDRFNLSEAQGQAILEMKLRRLTGLERGKIENELAELLELINSLRAILASEEKVLSIIKDEMLEIKQKYADERRTSIDMSAIEYIEDESLIPENNVMITLTKNGYIKRLVSESYKTQNRGGVGVKGITTNEEDYVEHLINLSTHDYVLFFTNKGKVYRLKGYEIPEFSKQSKGLPIINLLQVEKGEIVNSIIKLSKDDDSKYLLFATKKGIVKRTKVEDFDNIRATGKISIKLKDNDELIAVRKSDGQSEVLMSSTAGRLAKFNENDVRVMGRTASGVRGINLNGAECIGAEVATAEQEIIFVTEKGYGKKTKALEYRLSKRGGKGVKAMSITEKNGNLSSFKIAYPEHDLMIITNTGMIIRMPLEQVSTLGRVTQGVRLINIKNDQKVATISVVPKPDENENSNESSD